MPKKLRPPRQITRQARQHRAFRIAWGSRRLIASDHKLLYYERTWSFVPKPLIDNPFWLYGVMMLFFYLGIIIFSCLAMARIFNGTHT